MHKGESLLEKKVKKYYSFYFTGEELKLRDALLFIQVYNHLSDLLKELESTSSVLVCLNMQTLLYFYLVFPILGILKVQCRFIFLGNWYS